MIRIVYYLIIVTATVAYILYLVLRKKNKVTKIRGNIYTGIYLVIIITSIIISNMNPIQVSEVHMERIEDSNNYKLEFLLTNKTYIPVAFSGVIWSNVQGRGCLEIKSATLESKDLYNGFKG